MNGIRLTRRGYMVVGVLATIGFLFLMGVVGWIEGWS